MVNNDGLEIANARVRYGASFAVDDVSLAVAPGEVVAVIGPSGCGKSSLLRAVAGLEPLAGGRVSWAGEDLSGIDTHRRNFGLMFQEHALFAHRDVAANVEFGMRMQGVDRSVRERRVGESLELVGLAGFAHRAVDSLSGGEAQRVALARALAPRPRLLMLDEPLGSLDRSLRERLARDIRTSVRELGIAAIHVTHDQDEAFAVADRVAVMQAGQVLANDAPVRLWRDPGREFVARFLGLHDIVDGSAAAALGFASPPDGRAVALLPGALQVVHTGELTGRLVDARITTSSVHATVDVEGVGFSLNIVASHGSPEALRLLATPTDAALRLHLRHEFLAMVDRDR